MDVLATSRSSAELVVILCTPRSGSTLLSVLLGGHSRIMAPPELHLFRRERFDDALEKYPKSVLSLQWLFETLGKPHSEHQVQARFCGRSTEEVCRQLLTACGSSYLLVDKSPSYSYDAEALRRVERFEPRYIWLIRHPLGVAASRLELRDKRLCERLVTDAGKLCWAKHRVARLANRVGDVVHCDVRKYLRYWTSCQSRLQEFSDSIPQSRQIQVHFENLVTSPSTQLAQVCEFLDIDFEATMLEPGTNTPSVMQRGIGDEKIKQQKGVNAKVAENWRQTLNSRVLNSKTRRLMHQLEIVS